MVPAGARAKDTWHTWEEPGPVGPEAKWGPGDVEWRAGGNSPKSHTTLLAECSSFSPPTTVILLILLCFEGLLFLIFTSVMFGTQVHSICTDETVSGRPAPHLHSAAWGGSQGGCCGEGCVQAGPGSPASRAQEGGVPAASPHLQ